MKPLIEKNHLERLSLTGLERLARDPAQPERTREAAAMELVGRLVSIYIEGLLKYHEPGWVGICPMWCGLLPGGGSGEDDPIDVAAWHLRRISRAEEAATVLLSHLSPRQRVAVLVDTWRDGKMTRAEACQPDNWERICALLALRRQLDIRPSDCELVTPAALNGMVCRSKKELQKTVMQGLLEKGEAA